MGFVPAIRGKALPNSSGTRGEKHSQPAIEIFSAPCLSICARSSVDDSAGEESASREALTGEAEGTTR